MLDMIRWHGGASFAILNGTHIYINPRRIVRPDRPADIIIIGSGHYEHCSSADIDKIRAPHTLIVASPSAANHIDANVVLRPFQSTSLGRACVKGVPLYQSNGMPDPSGDLGFVVSTSLYDIYYTGQTSALPEASSLHPDVVIMPITGANSLNHDTAAAAVRQMRPRWVIPFGWNTVGRTGRVEAQSFASVLGTASEVITLDPNP